MMDCAMGVNVGETTIKLVFDGYEIPEIADISKSADAEDLDFTLVMPTERWQEMIENIQTNGHADLHHTLNTIDLESPEELAKGDDYNRPTSSTASTRHCSLSSTPPHRLRRPFA